jgi:hypothetical protein
MWYVFLYVVSFFSGSNHVLRVFQVEGYEGEELTNYLHITKVNVFPQMRIIIGVAIAVIVVIIVVSIVKATKH